MIKGMSYSVRFRRIHYVFCQTQRNMTTNDLMTSTAFVTLRVITLEQELVPNCIYAPKSEPNLKILLYFCIEFFNLSVNKFAVLQELPSSKKKQPKGKNSIHGWFLEKYSLRKCPKRGIPFSRHFQHWRLGATTLQHNTRSHLHRCRPQLWRGMLVECLHYPLSCQTQRLNSLAELSPMESLPIHRSNWIDRLKSFYRIIWCAINFF